MTGKLERTPVVIITALPSDNIYLVTLGSMPVENSSIMIADRYPISTIASEFPLVCLPSLLARRSAYGIRDVPMERRRCSQSLWRVAESPNWMLRSSESYVDGRKLRAKSQCRVSSTRYRITDALSMITPPTLGKTSSPAADVRERPMMQIELFTNNIKTGALDL